MAGYWLTAVVGTEPAVLPKGRVRLTTEEGEELRRMAGTAHPRLLPSFKLAMLLGDEDEACGTGADVTSSLPLEEPVDIELSGPFVVSHCGAAFLDRLPHPAEALALAAALPPVSHVRTLLAWWREGKGAILLKEE
ncbi:MAG TPA: hypothetical protein VEZ72_00650 [Paenibacillus sp.]|nr:hypothetical protein [Paenibacillus sp.]